MIVLIAVGLFISGIPLHAESLRERYWPKTGVIPNWNQAGEIVITPGEGSPVYQAGILEGDLLIAVNGEAARLKPGDSLENLIPDVNAGMPVSLTVRTGNHPPREYTIYAGGPNAVPLARLGLSKNFVANYSIVLEVIFALVCLGIAGIIFLLKSNDWLALLASLSFILLLFGVSENTILFYVNNPIWRPALDLWFVLILFESVVFFCLFPNGRFVSRWMWVVPVIGVVWVVAQWLDPRLYPWKMSFQKGFGMIVVWLSIGLLVQFYRYRYHSNAIQRQQTKWVVFGMLASSLGVLGLAYNTAFPGVQLPSGIPTVAFDLIGYPVIQLLLLFLPLTIGIAILRYRLWDIDIIINRTLVYGTLTASVIGMYVVVVGVLGTAIQGRGNLLVSILATGLVAVLVQPMRDRLQRAVNRMMYGERDDPVTVLSRLGARLEGTLAPDAVLPSLVETVAQALKLPYAAIATASDDHAESGATIAYGMPQSEVIRLPLIYQSEPIGQFIVSPRAPGEALSPMDRHLLENIAHQAGMAVHAVSLTADLQRSRQRLVTAREEERRRLRRDLHDGLGPNLASQGLKLAAVKRLAKDDPVSALPLLEQVMAQNQTTVEEVRRLVYGLRPPALDELGLVAAIRDYVAGMDGKSTLQIEFVEPPEGLPPLSAAVEVAAYRIVLEALTNVIRHAQARHCAIRFSCHQNNSHALLQIEIIDDGIGLPADLRSGVGLRSMRERAEELGGSLTVESRLSITRVLAILPISETMLQAHSLMKTPAANTE
jgi:signal transduction histidine kinase